MPEKYRDPDWISEQYVNQGRSMEEIADLCDCSISTISRWISDHGIAPRSPGAVHRKPGLNLEMTPKGYMRWHGTRGEDGEREDYHAYVHRLLAVAEYGTIAYADGIDVHHLNGIPWDNRPDNIELIDRAEHGSIHSIEGNAKRWGDSCA